MIIEAMCGSPRFVPWYDVNWGVLRNDVAFSRLAASVTAAAPVLGTEVLSKVTHSYEGRPVNEYTARNKTTGIIYKVFPDSVGPWHTCRMDTFGSLTKAQAKRSLSIMTLRARR
jgi:hypothetical protein